MTELRKDSAGKKISYEDKLRILNMTTLEKRRERGDVIAVFKILKNFDDTGSHQYFNLV